MAAPRPRPVRDPFAHAGDQEPSSEYGVPVGHVARLARKALPPDEGGVYRAKAPQCNPALRKHETGYPGKWVAP